MMRLWSGSARDGDRFRGVKETQATRQRDSALRWQTRQQQRGLVASPVKSSSANESVASPQKERSLFGGLHEDTLKLIMDMVPEDGAFVVQLSCKTLHSPVRAFLLCVRKD